MEEQQTSREDALARLAAVFDEPAQSGVSADERAKVLTTLYQEYGKRFVADNNRIWTTAASMIPLSLGAFALLASIQRPTVAQVIVLPVIGWLLMSIWLVIAENHRAFQDRSMAWLRDIERAWGLPADARRQSSGLIVRPGLIRRMRYALWIIVTVGAVATILWWPGGLLIDL